MDVVTKHIEDLRNLDPNELQSVLKKDMKKYKTLMAYFSCAMMEIETKFKVLNEEFSIESEQNPIETIKSRLKSPESIIEKAKKLGIAPTVENIEANIFDIAGVRVICTYQSDIYMLADSFLKQDDVTLIQRKDYIENPKENGYRSLHLIVETPIFLHDQKKLMKVEIQLRTLSMDWWASLEHKIRYKKDIPEEQLAEISRDLKACAEIGSMLDKRMEGVSKKIAVSE